MRVCEAANLTIADLPADSAYPDHQAGRVPILTGDRRTNDGREASPPRSVYAVVRRGPAPTVACLTNAAYDSWRRSDPRCRVLHVRVLPEFCPRDKSSCPDGEWRGPLFRIGLSPQRSRGRSSRRRRTGKWRPPRRCAASQLPISCTESGDALSRVCDTDLPQLRSLMRRQRSRSGSRDRVASIRTAPGFATRSRSGEAR